MIPAQIQLIPGICFFGTYLSRKRGHLAPSQAIAKALSEKGYGVALVSDKLEPYARFLQSTLKAVFGKMDFAIVDIYSTRVIYLNWLVCRILFIRSIPYIAVLHGGAIPERWELIKKWLSPIIQKAKVVSSPSLYIRDFLSGKNVTLNYIPNSLNLARFPFRKHEKVHSPVRLLWVRAFTEIYHPKLAVEVVKELLDRGIDCRLTMIGPDLGKLKQINSIIARLELEDHVTIQGSVPNHELHQFFHESDIFLNTTEFESFGLAVAEAASCGIPILSRRVGELPYLWEHNKSILFCEPNAASFADQIQFLIANNESYQNMALAASQSAKQFELASVIEKWEELFKVHGLVKTV